MTKLREVTFTGGEISPTITVTRTEELARHLGQYDELWLSIATKPLSLFYDFSKWRPSREPSSEDRAVHAAIGKSIPDGRRLGCAQYLGDE